MLNFIVGKLLELVWEHGLGLVCCEVMAVAWLWARLLRRNAAAPSWRAKPTSVAVVLASTAVFVDGALALQMKYGSGVYLFTFAALIVMGLLSIGGIACAVAGRGVPRGGATMLSLWLFVIFGLKALLAINSFH